MEEVLLWAVVTYAPLELHCFVIELALRVLEKKGRDLIEEASYLTHRSFKVMGQKDLNSVASVVYFTVLLGRGGGEFYYCSWNKLRSSANNRLHLFSFYSWKF
jgi:hypothetical protein